MKLTIHTLRTYMFVFTILLAGLAGLAKPPELTKIAELPNSVTIAGPLLFAANGAIYGTSLTGGRHKDGFLYVVRPDGTTATLVDFDHKTCGASPTGTLVAHPDGGILGTTLGGGDRQLGTVFHVAESGEFRTLYNFHPGGPEHPETGLFIAPWPPNPILGTASDARLPDGVLFEINIKGQMAKIAKLPGCPSSVVVESESKRIYGLSARGGTVKRGHTNLSSGTVFRYIPGIEFDSLLPIQANGGDTVNSGRPLNSSRQIYRQWPIMTSKKLLVFPTFLGGRWGEGELISLNSDKQATTLKAFHLMEPLNASIGSLTVDPQGVIYGVMSTTFTYDANNHKVQLPSGAICRISPSGATELVYALNSGGPGQALQWHAGALYGVGGKALYRLAPSSPDN